MRVGWVIYMLVVVRNEWRPRAGGVAVSGNLLPVFCWDLRTLI